VLPPREHAAFSTTGATNISNSQQERYQLLCALALRQALEPEELIMLAPALICCSPPRLLLLLSDHR